MAEQALPGLDTPEERRFHDRYDAIANFMRWALYLVVALVALGVVGTGPLSWAESTAADGTVRYERFARHGATWTMEVETDAPDGPIAVTIDDGFHSGQDLMGVTPEPSSVTVSDDGIAYRFETESSASESTIVFRFRADALWRQAAEIRVGDGPAVRFTQFVYP